MPDCRLGEPCVYVHASKTSVTVGEQVDLNLSIVNSMIKPPMTAQLLLRVPSGMKLSGHSFAEGCTGQCNANYTIDSGENKHINMELRPNQPGTFRVTGKVEWFFKGSGGAVVEGKNLDITITVDPVVIDTPVVLDTPTPVPAAGGACGRPTDTPGPIDAGNLVLLFGPMALIASQRRWNRRTPAG